MFATLIRQGHLYKDILWEYCPEEISMYYKEAVKGTMDATKQTSIACRMGFGADKGQWKKFMDELEGKQKRGAVSPEFINHLQALQAVKNRRAGSHERVPKPPQRPASLE